MDLHIGNAHRGEVLMDVREGLSLLQMIVVRSRAGMKRTAQNTAERTQNILTTHIQGLPQETFEQMHNSETLKRDIRRQRRPDHPPVPDANNTQFALP